MRKSLIEQAKSFILENTEKNNFVFNSKEIKTSLKNFLIENWYLYSPIKNIFLLKKNNEDIYNKIEENKFCILEKLTLEKKEILSWEFLINYYLNKPEKSKIFRIITKSKNFESILWDTQSSKNSAEKIKIIFKPSNIPRLSRKIKIGDSSFEIETKLSFIVNNYFLFKDNTDFKKIILETNFDIFEIESLIKNKFKFSAISKLAIFYKNNEQKGKYEIIMKAIKNCWKKIDRRWTKVVKKQNIKKKKIKVDLNDLF